MSHCCFFFTCCHHFLSTTSSSLVITTTSSSLIMAFKNKKNGHSWWCQHWRQGYILTNSTIMSDTHAGLYSASGFTTQSDISPQIWHCCVAFPFGDAWHAPSTVMGWVEDFGSKMCLRPNKRMGEVELLRATMGKGLADVVASFEMVWRTYVGYGSELVKSFQTMSSNSLRVPTPNWELTKNWGWVTVGWHADGRTSKPQTVRFKQSPRHTDPWHLVAWA